LPEDTKGLATENLKEMRPGDTSVSLSKLIGQKYQEMLKEKKED
jgi:hypothetical protein